MVWARVDAELRVKVIAFVTSPFEQNPFCRYLDRARALGSEAGAGPGLRSVLGLRRTLLRHSVQVRVRV